MSNIIYFEAIPQSFEVTLRSLRRALNSSGLSVVGLVDLSRTLGSQLAAGPNECVLILVDCPLLLFEAVALEVSAATFIPLHVVLAGDQYSTCIHWAHPAEGLGLHIPSVAKGAVDTLAARVTEVVRTVSSRFDAARLADIGQTRKVGLGPGDGW